MSSPQSELAHELSLYMSGNIDELHTILTNENSSNIRKPKEKSKAPETNELDVLQKEMHTWITVDDQIKGLNKEVKVLRDQKSLLSQELIKDMSKLQVGILCEGDKKVKYVISKNKKPYNRKFIKDKLTEYFDDEKKAEEIAEYLEKSREMVTKVNIRRGTNKD
jgi:hypothetical protein